MKVGPCPKEFVLSAPQTHDKLLQSGYGNSSLTCKYKAGYYSRGGGGPDPPPPPPKKSQQYRVS